MIVDQELIRREPGLGHGPEDGGPPQRLSVPVLQAALEVERNGREWLEGTLATWKVEQEDLRVEVERLREALSARELAASALGEQATAAAAEATKLTSQLAAMERERGGLARLLEEAGREYNALSQQRDTLAAQIEAIRSEPTTVPDAVAQPDPDEPTPGELGDALELMAQSLGDVHTWTQDMHDTEQRSISAIVLLEARLRTLLAPLASLPDLRAHLARLDARLDAISVSVDLATRDEARRSALTSIRGTVATITNALGDLRGDLGGALPSGAAAGADMVSWPWAGGAKPQCSPRPLLTMHATERALSRALPAIGVPRSVVTPLLASWLAGAMPIVSGSGALSVLQACGRVLAEDRVVVVSVHPTLFRPSQLFGRIHPGSGAMVPAASRLPDVLLDALSKAGSDRLALVVLDGLNRSTVESFLLPLLDRKAARHGPAGPRALGEVLPGPLDADDPYASLATASWPSNVLLAATLSDGGPTVPLPSSIWAHAMYVCLDHLPEQPETQAQSGPVLPIRRSFVPAELWHSWTGSVRREADLSACAMPEADVPSARGDVVAAWRTIEAALTLLGGNSGPSEDGHGSVLLHHAVVPWAVTAGLTRELAQLVETQSGERVDRPYCSCLERVVRGTPSQETTRQLSSV